MDREARWFGVKISELSKEELYKVIDYLSKELQKVKKDRNRWMESADIKKYLGKGTNE